jgi:endonuclease/exonuclease/phosphatase family metal-dependent hydrolase
MSIRVGTFNNENLFFRYKLLSAEPKPFKKTPVPINFETMVDQFRDIDNLLKNYDDPAKVFQDKKEFEKFLKKLPSDSWRSVMTFMKGGSFINRLKGSLEDVEPISHTQRTHTAEVIYENKPDFVGVQEIESLEVLDEFYSKFIKKHLNLPYHMLIEGNDPRGIDVGLLDGNPYPVTNIKTHRYDPDPSEPNKHLFSRDCLEVDLALSNGENLTVYINHLKSKIGGGEQKRLNQATGIRNMVNNRFGTDLKGGQFIILGDFNCEPDEPELTPLLGDKKLLNIFDNLDKGEKWSHLQVALDKNDTNKVKSAEVSQFDYILLSPTIAQSNPNVKPIVERRGLVYYPEITEKLKKKDEDVAIVYDNDGVRFPSVEKYGTEASDHCGVFVDLDL